MGKIIRKVKAKTKATKKKINIIRNLIDNRNTIFDLFKRIPKLPKRFKTRFKESKSKFCFILRSLLGSRIVIIILVLVLIEKTKLFYNQTLPMQTEEFENIYLFTFIFIVITLIPLLFVRKDKNRFYLGIIIDLLLSILLFADNLYCIFSSNMLSVSQISYVRYSEEITNVLPYFLEAWQLQYFIDIPIFILLWIIRKITTNKIKNEIY